MVSMIQRYNEVGDSWLKSDHMCLKPSSASFWPCAIEQLSCLYACFPIWKIAITNNVIAKIKIDHV